MNPLNWSCWLELGSLCLIEKYPIPFDLTSIHQILNALSSDMDMDVGLDGLGLDAEVSSILISHLKTTTTNTSNTNTSNTTKIELFRTMSLCFLVYIYLEQHKGDEALIILQQYLIKLFPNSVINQSNIALCYYTLRNYNIAHQCFESVREKDPYRMEHIDTYSNILYVKECRSELSYLAHSVMKINKYTTQTCCIVGNYYSLKGQHEKAILYFRRAIKINHNYLSGKYIVYCSLWY